MEGDRRDRWNDDQTILRAQEPGVSEVKGIRMTLSEN